MTRRYYAGADFRRALSIDELRRVAQARLPRFEMEYVEGGAEDEVALRRNRSIFERITWLPRMLVGTGLPDVSRTVLGETLHMPLIIAPTGFNGMLWPQGDLALAKAADAAGIAFTLSTVSNYDVVALNPQLQRPAWFQLYPLKDQKTSDRLIERAQAAGCDKLVVTVDVPALGAREWDQRNYSRPLKLSPSSVLDVLLHPRWLWQVMVPKGAPEFANLTEFLPPGARSALQGVRFMGTQINPTLNWADIERMRQRWKGKLILKGILCVEDAKHSVDAGADGIVLSNHGGRQLDSCATGIELVGQCAAELGGKLALLVDGGFRRGSDVLKAIALGADAVMIGRPALYGLGAGGEAGVAHALGLLRGEMERAMTLLGCHSLDQLGPHLIRT
ncbi:MAG: alpha-hydroxy-acid oxidizing protein [Gammaproteobacteria bacterium]|nr:alpha-hydroxy-acid oxidizing protein [Gammaproteobacteria bacterium]